jgi:alpha,alpha-trehalose phosphorylase
LDRLSFKLRYRGRILHVTALPQSAIYVLLEGAPIRLNHHGEPFVLTATQPETKPIPAAPKRPAPKQPPGREPFLRHTDS